MIPAFFADDTPPGEADVFRMLAGGPDDWVALHALDLAPWNRSLRTEIDFLVIVPRRGIICIEVKSHENLSFDGQRWSPPEIRKSPFRQALDSSCAFYRRFCDLAPDLRHVPVVHLCIFPRASFDIVPNMSVLPCELIEQRQFRSAENGTALCSMIEDRMRSSIAQNRAIHELNTPLPESLVKRITELCFPVRSFRPDVRREIEARESEAGMLLREQQKPVFRLAEHNSRLIVRGAAGTGKTLIAAELAMRISGKGRRVAFLCFNQLIGDWIEAQVHSRGEPHPGLVAGRAVSVLARLSGTEIPASPRQTFWDHDFPVALNEAFSDQALRGEAEFDCLIIDEAQDVLARPWLWNILCRLLKGGVMEGCFVLFGDFGHQVLSEAATMNKALSVLIASVRPAIWTLDENCRNYPVIARTAVQLSGFTDEVYSGYLRSGGSADSYDLTLYRDVSSQGNELARLIREFRGRGYSDADIVVLSFQPEGSQVVHLLKDRGIMIVPAWQKRKQISYASVRAYKGMERKVVILTDLGSESDPLLRNLFYTGMTRATEYVRVVCSETFAPVLLDWLKQGEKT